MRRQFVGLLILALLLFGVAAASVPSGRASEQTRAMPDGRIVVRKIKRFQKATWRWQQLMGVPRTRNRGLYLRTRDLRYRMYVLHQWRRRAVRAKRRAHNPPHESAWRCIHRYERDPHQGWRTNTGNGYYGGLQMDISFQRQYGRELLSRKGTADQWTQYEQMWAAERALRAGRGFNPWPRTARTCGLL